MVTLAVVLVFLSPDTLAGNIIQVGAFALFAAVNWRSLSPHRDLAAVVFAVVFSLSLIESLFAKGASGTWQGYARNLMVLCFFVFFPIRVHGYTLDHRLLTGLLFALVLSQMALVFDVSPLSDHIRLVYFGGRVFPTYSGDAMLAALDGSVGDGLRSGGFVGNPNQAAKFMNLLLACYLAAATCQSHRWADILFASLYSFGQLLTGSRTGFVVTLALLAGSSRGNTGRAGKGVGFGLTLLGFVAYLAWSGWLARSLSFGAGLRDSLGTKVELLTRYLGAGPSPLVMLVGNFFAETGPLQYPSVFSLVRFNFDADMGYFVYAFGLLGTACLVLRLTALAIRHPRLRPSWPLLLWFFTASLFFHFRFIILLFVLLSLACGSDADNRCEAQAGSLAAVPMVPGGGRRGTGHRQPFTPALVQQGTTPPQARPGKGVT